MFSKPFKKRFKQWMSQHNPPSASSISLHNRRLYILPTRFGVMYCFLLLVIFLAAINYQNSLSFVLSFLLTAIGIVSLWQTHKNLLHIEARLIPPTAVFCGETIELPIVLSHQHPFHRYSIGLQYQNHAPNYINLEPNSEQQSIIRLPTSQRGVYSLDGITIFTRFPTGLFHCWGWLQFTQSVTVYPTPISAQLTSLAAESDQQGTHKVNTIDGDDFEGLREYKQGESLKHISWKALAQGRGKLTKTFHGNSQPSLWLDWDKITASSIEERLSKLTSLVLKAHTSGQQFGLKIPGTLIEKDSGLKHKEQCLHALTVYHKKTTDMLNVSS